MLIICSGPDTFRALEKAQELERAFLQKHDAEQVSTEHLSPLQGSIVEQVLERINTPSLFTPRRFMRVYGLIQDCPKAKQAALWRALIQDVENTIIVSCEEEKPNSALEKNLQQIPKYFCYEFPLQQGVAFTGWVRATAFKLGLKLNESDIRALADSGNGDSWFVWNELMKLAAGAEFKPGKLDVELNYYDLADHFLQDQLGWRVSLDEQDQSTPALQALLSQTRAVLQVRSGVSDKLPAFLVKKLQRLHSSSSAEAKLARILLYYFCQRSGLANEKEASTLL